MVAESSAAKTFKIGRVVFEIWQFYNITLWSTNFIMPKNVWKGIFSDFSVLSHISLVDSPWQGNDLMKTSGT